MGEKIKHSQKEIAEAFSIGNFELTFPYLANNITWNIIGENEFKGKLEVVANCKRTAEYFKSVQTEFITEDLIGTDQRVIVIGTGEFKRNGKRINLISACDVYEFNDNTEIIKISSYCIPERK